MPTTFRQRQRCFGAAKLPRPGNHAVAVTVRPLHRQIDHRPAEQALVARLKDIKLKPRFDWIGSLPRILGRSDGTSGDVPLRSPPVSVAGTTNRQDPRQNTDTDPGEPVFGERRRTRNDRLPKTLPDRTDWALNTGQLRGAIQQNHATSHPATAMPPSVDAVNHSGAGYTADHVGAGGGRTGLSFCRSTAAGTCGANQ